MSTQVGVESLYIAIMTTEDTLEANAIYDTPVYVAPAIGINIQPQGNTSVLFADDGAIETESANGPVNVSINPSELPLDKRALILGAAYNAGTGVITHKATDRPPYLALGFKSRKANGDYRYVWLLKGKAVRPQENYQTKTDNVQFNTPQLNLQFVRRKYDNADYVYADEPVFTSGAIWFNDVYVPGTDTTPPTVTVSPVDGATNVSVSANIVWTFSEAINTACVTTRNFLVIKSDGTVVAGALSVNGLGTIVTFDPTVNLAAASDYIAIATTNVRDLAGNALAAASVVNFTTAA